MGGIFAAERDFWDFGLSWAQRVLGGPVDRALSGNPTLRPQSRPAATMAGRYAGAIPVSKTKYVEYASRGFWAYDVALEIFLKHLIDAAEASDQAGTAWLSEATSEWLRVASIGDIGLTLNEGWSPEQQRHFVSLAEAACARLAERVSIPAEEIVGWALFEDLRIYPRGATEVLTAPIGELGRAIIALISGTLAEPPTGSLDWLYGTDEGRTTLGRMSIRRRLRKNERDLIVAMLGGKSSSLEFCILCQRLRPFHKGLEDFSSVRIQSGVAENPLLPSRVT